MNLFTFWLAFDSIYLNFDLFGFQWLGVKADQVRKGGHSGADGESRTEAAPQLGSWSWWYSNDASTGWRRVPQVQGRIQRMRQARTAAARQQATGQFKAI